MLYRCPGFAQSEEAAPIERLLDAYYECDQDAAELVTKSPLFKFMENDVSCTVHCAEEMCTSIYCVCLGYVCYKKSVSVKCSADTNDVLLTSCLFF